MPVFGPGSDIRGVWVVLWVPVVMLVVLGAGLRYSAGRSVRRAAVNLCQKCRYDLRGLAASAPCPECGQRRAKHPATPMSASPGDR